MKFRSVIKVYIAALLISGVVFLIVSSLQYKNENWKEIYSREYLESLSDKNFKQFVDNHRNISGIGYIEVEGKKLGRQIENPSNIRRLLTVKHVEKIIFVMVAIGIFIIGYYLISRLTGFLRRYNHKKNAPRIKNADDRKFEEHQSPEERYMNIFGLKGNSTEDEIKKKYRELISQYHPDKVQHLGREFQQMAEYKTKEIQKAYNYFKQNYNISS